MVSASVTVSRFMSLAILCAIGVTLLSRSWVFFFFCCVEASVKSVH